VKLEPQWPQGLGLRVVISIGPTSAR
jgi:hypothetical protein